MMRFLAVLLACLLPATALGQSVVLCRRAVKVSVPCKGVLMPTGAAVAGTLCTQKGLPDCQVYLKAERKGRAADNKNHRLRMGYLHEDLSACRQSLGSPGKPRVLRVPEPYPLWRKAALVAAGVVTTVLVLKGWEHLRGEL